MDEFAGPARSPDPPEHLSAPSPLFTVDLRLLKEPEEVLRAARAARCRGGQGQAGDRIMCFTLPRGIMQATGRSGDANLPASPGRSPPGSGCTVVDPVAGGDPETPGVVEAGDDRSLRYYADAPSDWRPSGLATLQVGRERRDPQGFAG